MEEYLKEVHYTMDKLINQLVGINLILEQAKPEQLQSFAKNAEIEKLINRLGTKNVEYRELLQYLNSSMQTHRDS